MRYHWGLGVGHLHAHQTSESAAPCNKPEMPQAEGIQADQSPDCIPADSEVPSENLNPVDAQQPPPREDDGDAGTYDSDCPELCLDDREAEGWEDIDSDSEPELDDGEFEEGFDDEDMDDEDEDEDFTGL